MITLYRTDKRGRIHYYSIDDRQGQLFSSCALTVHWGPAMTAGREKVHLFADEREKDEKLRELILGRISAGYRVLYSFFRNNEYHHLKPALEKGAAS